MVSTLFVFSKGVFLITSTFYLLFFLAVTGRLKFLSVKPLIILGSMSYSLYLLHQNIGYVVINKLYNIGVNPIISIILAILTTLSLAYLTTRFVEKPSLIVIRNAYRKISA
jgi:peptidoglycan/LPS O-acetylase OafA/YrhL